VILLLRAAMESHFGAAWLYDWTAGCDDRMFTSA
jgi:hypothetical protein